MINMATSKQTSAASLVCLVEVDTSRAQLPQSTPEECSITKLKHWLLCRAASTTITDRISTKGTNQEVSENIRSGKISPFDFSNGCLTSKLVIKSCDIFRFAGQP